MAQNTQDGGVNVWGQARVGNDLVGRDKITIHQYGIPGGPMTPPPRHLPPPPRDFIGRGQEIAELTTAIEKDAVTILALQGLGGVGKTALGLKIAEQLTPHYSDAQFFLDLKGESKKPLEAKDATGYVIRSCLPGARLPEDDSELNGLYRSVLHGKRVILLMDNAKDGDQIAPLIPPASSLLLITSRRHFALPGMLAKNLDTLPPKDGRDLMLRIAGQLVKQQKDYASDLARLCGYIPLAMRSVASALATRVDLNPADCLRKLTDARERLRLTATDASLSLSYDLLAAELQERFRTLAVFPDAFEIDAASAVWETEHSSAQDSLSDLCLYSLVEYVATSRYRLHDLVRLFADSHLIEAERASGQKLHAVYYRNVAKKADELYLEGNEGIRKGLALFDIEWANIQVGQDWAVTHAKEDETALRLCCDFPGASNCCAELRQLPGERILWLEEALLAARQLHDREAECAHAGNLGCAYYSVENYLGAIEHFERQIQIAREIGNRTAEGHGLGNLGLAHHSLGEYKRAVNYYVQQLAIAREVGDRRGEGSALNNLGIDCHCLQEYDRATEYHEQYLQITREVGDRRGEGMALGNLGSDCCALGEYRRAIDYLEQDLAITREIGDKRGEKVVQGSLGFAHYKLGDYRRAFECHERCLLLAKETGDKRNQGKALWNMSMALHAVGERDHAIANAEAALKLFEELEDGFARRVSRHLEMWRAERDASGPAAV